MQERGEVKERSEMGRKKKAKWRVRAYNQAYVRVLYVPARARPSG